MLIRSISSGSRALMMCNRCNSRSGRELGVTAITIYPNALICITCSMYSLVLVQLEPSSCMDTNEVQKVVWEQNRLIKRMIKKMWVHSESFLCCRSRLMHLQCSLGPFPLFHIVC